MSNSPAEKVLARIAPKPAIGDLVSLELAAPHFGKRPRATPKTKPAEWPTQRLTPLESGLGKMLAEWNRRALEKD